MAFMAIAFLNTHWCLTHQEKKDPLLERDALNWLMQKMIGHPLPEEMPPSEMASLSKELIAFRGELMQLIGKIEADAFDEAEAIALLNRYLQASSGCRRIHSGDSQSPVLRFEPDRADQTYLLSQLASDWFELFFDMDRTRIRICENPDCLCYFYDESKNKSKRHCAPNCSNVMKVRRHREKKSTPEL